MPHSPATTPLSVKQHQALQLIAQGLGRRDVAAQLEIDPGTLSRWRRQPAFQDELAKLLLLCEREAVESFRAVKMLAVERLGTLVNSQNPTVALKAVDMVLTHTDLRIPTITTEKSYAERSDDQLDGILDQLLNLR